MVTCDLIGRYRAVISHNVSRSFTAPVTLLWPGILISALRTTTG